MNLASWIILAVVVALLAMAVKATFFKKKGHGSCCDAGDCDAGHRSDGSVDAALSATGDLSLDGLSCAGSCGGCAAASGCATARNSLQPTYKSLK